MPVRRSGNFDLNAGVVQLTREKLAGFLDETELAQTEVKLEGGKISFMAPESVLAKITQHLGQPAGRLSSTTGKQKSPADLDLRGFHLYGGEIGIRTLGTVASTTDFESVPFGHSGISPTARMITALFVSGKALFQKNRVLSVACALLRLKAGRQGAGQLLRRLR